MAPGNDPVYDGVRPVGTALLEIIEEGAQGRGRGFWK